MSVTDDIEKKLGIKIDDLNPVEKETYFKMLEVVQKSQLSVEKIREYIHSMKEAVEKELVNEPEFTRIFIFKVDNRRQILLKARLQNYMILESFLLSPVRAQNQMDSMISNLAQGSR